MTDREGVIGWPRVRRSSLVLFFLLSAISAWYVWLSSLDARGAFNVHLLGNRLSIPISFALLVLGNCIPGVLALIWTVFEGREACRNLFSRLVRWRVGLKWYLLAVAMPCCVYFCVMEVVVLLFPTQHPFPYGMEFVKSLAFTLPFGPLWEEIAWRGFALPRLETRISFLRAASILGIYWAIWHVPLWLIQLRQYPFNKAPFVIASSISIVSWSIIWSYLYHRAQESLPVVILLHSTYGAAADAVSYAIPRLNGHVIYVEAICALCLAVVFARYLRGLQIAGVT